MSAPIDDTAVTWAYARADLAARLKELLRREIALHERTREVAKRYCDG